ncbi:MAG: hypothetical protein P1U88_04740 [Thalassobaculaceae bacterium]|nr:hypothetical protein [Thalassobaculaceae bacterium]
MSRDASAPGRHPEAGSRDLGPKLRLIMRTLGTETQKQLLARLRLVNPDTRFSPAKAYKWITGRASPRDMTVFDDLARLLDLQMEGEAVGGDWVRSVDFDGFYRKMLERYGTRVSRDMAPSALNDRDANPGGSVSWPPVNAESNPIPSTVDGQYLAISPAWSVHRSGALVIAEFNVRRRGGDTVIVEYRERLPGGDLEMTGTLVRFGRCLHVVLRDADGDAAITMVFSIPATPASLLAGVMCGVAMHDATTRPVAGRIACIDVQRLCGAVSPPRRELGAIVSDLGAYCPATAAGVRGILEAVGAPAGEADGIAGLACAFLREGAAGGLISVDTAAVNDITGKLII